MKMLFVLLFILAMQTSASTFAQKISLSVSNAELADVLDQIQNQTNLDFLYNATQLKNVARIDLDVKGADLQKVLNACLTPRGLVYVIQNNTVLIKKAAAADKASATTDVQQQVNGVVRDAEGVPIRGASVLYVNSNIAAATDDAGRFTLRTGQPEGQLLITAIGYEEQSVTFRSGEEIQIVLQAVISDLEEVVIVGYGEQKRANLTGAVATIESDQLENRVVSNAASALQGVDPSINLTLGSGTLDSDYQIDIRGVASINGGTPLILMDGIEVNLTQVNPNDIASISVLKDASASAIYGAKASSGVILITSKQGTNRDGQARISYNGRFGASQNTTSTDFIRTGYDHVNVVNQFYDIYQGTNMLRFDEDEMQLLYERRNDKSEHPDRPWTIIGDDDRYYYYGNTDWYGHFFKRTRAQKENSLSIDGGTAKTKYYVSGRIWDQDGIFNQYNDNLKNYSTMGKLTTELKPWLRYTATANFNAGNYLYAGFADEQRTFHALQSNINSAFVPWNPDGSVVQYTNQLNANSPLGAGHGGFLTANEARNSRKSKNMVLSNRFDADVTKDLVLTGMYAYRYRNNLQTHRNMPFDYSREVGNVLSFTSGTIYDYYQEIHNNLNNHNLNLYGTFKKDVNDHFFTLTAGGQYEDYRSTNLDILRNDLLSKDLESFSVATGDAIIRQNINTFRTLGFFGRLNYDYKGKYLLEVSGRWDGTSRFAADTRWGFFPSASFGWKMSDEKFFDPLKSWWNFSKPRFSMGSLGNQQVSYYAYFQEINTGNILGNYTFDGTTRAPYSSVSQPIAGNLTWETVTTYNWGWDMAFLRNRLMLNADYYVRHTRDMLTQSLTLPSVYGESTPRANVADLRTNGWELYLGWRDNVQLGGKTLNYNFGGTLGDYQTTITRYHNPDKLISDYYEGMKLGEIWGYRVKGLFATDEAAAIYQENMNDRAVNLRVYNSKKENHLMAGDVEFIDLNGDGIINQGSGSVEDPGDRRVIGNALPRYSYSFRFGGDWNGFDLSVLFQGVGQQDWFPDDLSYDFWGPYSFPSLSFIHQDFLSNVWSPENPEGYFPKARGYASYSSGALGVATDRYLQDVSYLRLKNLTIGYTIPLNKRWFDTVRVYVSGENLHYWSKLKNYSKTVDPGIANSTATLNSGSGVGYPFSKIYTFGLSVNL